LGDYDINITSPTMKAKLDELGIAPSEKYGVFKTKDINNTFQQLNDFRTKWSGELGRDVNFVGYPKPVTRDATEYILRERGATNSIGANKDLKGWIDTEGTVSYGAKDTFGRPTGIYSIITPNTPKGTPPSQGRTPGFSRAQGHTRGHLLGAQLGGSGSDPRNLVTMFPAPNANAMSKIEDAVSVERNLGNAVEYSVTPIHRSEIPIPFRAQNSPVGPKPGYSPEDLIPQGITIRARSSSGKSFDVSVPNTPDWAKNLKGKFDPDQLWSRN
jgi:DNA/RNA non-specific endonuclease